MESGAVPTVIGAVRKEELVDPRSAGADPLASAATDLDSLDQASHEEQVEIFGRIHTALASALAGTSADSGPRPGG